VTLGDQFVLPLDSAPSYGREDFLVGKSNERAFDHIARWPHWLAPAALLIGPEGSGKTHLAAIFATQSHARMIRGDHLTLANVPEIARNRAVVLEDCDRFPPDEVALFHLFNLARETGLFLLLTARLPQGDWGVVLPDLASRLRLQPGFALLEPDDSLLAALFVKHIADRQIHVDQGVVAYALARIERSYRAVHELVATVDKLSLARKRPVTRALVAEALGRPAEDSDRQD